jgi:hypothetical protein
VADHPQELIPRRKPLIGVRPLQQQPCVGFLSFQVKEGSQGAHALRTFVSQLSVSGRTLRVQGCVLLCPLPCHALTRLCGRLTPRQPRIRLFAGRS